MSYRFKLTILVMAVSIIAFAEGYLLRGIGLQWLVPVVLLTAWGAVLVSRRVT
jgi:hypothetical protein